MVLSHKKLKRKREEEAAAAAEANPDAKAFAKQAEVKNAEEVVQRKKDKKLKKGKPVAVAPSLAAAVESDFSPEEVDGGVEIEKPVGGENAAKNKKKKEKKKRSKEASGDFVGRVDEARPSSEKLNGAVEHSGGDGQLTPDEGNRDVDGVNGGDEGVGQEAVGDDQKGMSVRERKGKKKKDRWGGAVQEEEQEQVNGAASKDDEEYKSQTSGKETESLSAGEEYDPKKVYVGGMPYYASEEDILDYFSECGKIAELDCVIFPDTGKFRGLAFITFQTEEGALKALEYDGADMGGRFLKITKCKVKPSKAKSAQLGEVKKHEGCLSVYIGNLSWEITEDAIKNFLKKHYKPTKVEAIRLAYDKDSGEFKGFGHIDFEDDESLEAAVRLNQTPLLGRPVKIAYSVPKRNLPSNGYSNAGGSQGSGRSPGACYNCGKEGHKSFLCPTKGENGDRGGRGGRSHRGGGRGRR